MTRVSAHPASGELHIGNYLGAVQTGCGCRASTTASSASSTYTRSPALRPGQARALTLDMAVSLFAVGSRPDKSIVFVQSHVPEHTELNWLLTTVTPLGELERQTQFKDIPRQGKRSCGMLAYPILQAADVLLYKAASCRSRGWVQHLELMRRSRAAGTPAMATAISPSRSAAESHEARCSDSTARQMSKSWATRSDCSPRRTIWRSCGQPPRIRRARRGRIPAIRHCNIFTIPSGLFGPRRRWRRSTTCTHRWLGWLDCKRVVADNMIAALTPHARACDAMSVSRRGC